MDWSKWARWFSYGKFKPAGLLKSGYVFAFDKDRIRHELNVNLFRVRFCPHLNQALLNAVLAELPNEVEVSANGDWNFKEDFDDTPGAISVKVKIVEDGYSYTKEFKSSGVEPRNPEIGIAILRKALQRIGADNGIIKSLESYAGR